MKKTLTLLTLSLSLAACSSPGVGMEVRAVTNDSNPSLPDAPLVFADSAGDEFALQSAYLRLRHIELDLPDGVSCSDAEDTLVGAECDSDGDKIRILGPIDVDLVSGTATPSLADVVIPAGTYIRLDFRVEDNPDDVAFAAVADFQHNGDQLSLDLSLDFNEDIRIESPGGITVDADTDLIAEFVVTNWLNGIDVGSCIDDGDVTMEGTTVFVTEGSTSGSCSSIEDTIKSNMKNSGQLDRD